MDESYSFVEALLRGLSGASTCPTEPEPEPEPVPALASRRQAPTSITPPRSTIAIPANESILLQQFKTKRGFIGVVHGGHRFHKKIPIKAVVHWKCSQDGCKVRLTTTPEYCLIKKESKPHTCIINQSQDALHLSTHSRCAPHFQCPKNVRLMGTVAVETCLCTFCTNYK